jgi:hypothetical protein
MYTEIYLINRSGGEKGGNGIECKCIIASWVQSIISYQPNLLLRCIYCCTFLNTIKLFSSVKLSEPNNNVSIEDNSIWCNIHK